MSPTEPPDPHPSRPRMAAGYGISQSESGLLSWSDAQARLRQARNYWIATTRPDGRPHVMPVWGLWMPEGFYFGTDPASRKGRNLAANPRAVVHLESGDEVVIVEGRVTAVDNPSRLASLVEAYHQKYKVRPEGLYWLQPRRAFAWTEKDFPNNATSWEFQ